ncbi:Protein OS-9 [Chytriomyces hyalinus]|nr:Protein OS-9 [Chytriomyces hyalinus]
MQLTLALAALVAVSATSAPSKQPSTKQPLTRQLVYSDLFASERFAVKFSKHPTGDISNERRVDVSVGSRRFSCGIPESSETPSPPPTPESISPDDADDDPEETAQLERKQSIWRGVNLVLAMAEKSCMQYIHGWWHYELCPKTHMRQFHPRSAEEAAKYPNKKQDYILGKRSTVASAQYSNADIVTVELEGKTQSYLSLWYEDGTACDIMGNNPRKTEVQFHCVPGYADYIHFVRETASCQYLVHVNSATLCGDEAFKAKPIALSTGAVHGIDANLILCEPIQDDIISFKMDDDSESPLSLRALTNVEPGAYSLASMYPDVLQAAAKEDPMAAAVIKALSGKKSGSRMTNLINNEDLMKKVQQALSELTKGDSTLSDASEVKMVELVIDEEGNIMMERGDVATLQKFMGTDMAENIKTVDTATNPAASDNDKAAVVAESQSTQPPTKRSMDDAIQQLVDVTEERNRKLLKAHEEELAKLKQEHDALHAEHMKKNEEAHASHMKRHEEQHQKNIDRDARPARLPDGHIVRVVQEEQRAATRAADQANQESSERRQRSSESYSSETIVEDGRIVKQKSEGTAAHQESRDGVEGPIEVITVDGNDGNLADLKDKVREILKNRKAASAKDVEAAKALLAQRIQNMRAKKENEKQNKEATAHDEL